VGGISEYIGKLTDLVENGAEERGIDAIPKERRGRHMIGLGLGPDAPHDLPARLAGENVFVSVRGRSLRVSPHLYNNERDVEYLFGSLDRHLR
jgi:selenocysteine lyase/cysteine desulfurase